MAKHKILVVDDEESLCEILQFNLEVEGYEADVAYSAEQALRMHPERYSLILLDVMMGEMSGFRMAQLLKADPETARVPVIFCTAKDSEDDTVAGLNIGADDYITKPFSVREVLARVRSVLRRTSAARAESESIRFEGLEIDLRRKVSTLDGKELQLTKKEFETLALLLSNRGVIFSREEILHRIWSDEVIVLDRTVDVNITRLRRKVGPNGEHIVTRLGYGYGFEAYTFLPPAAVPAAARLFVDAGGVFHPFPVRARKALQGRAARRAVAAFQPADARRRECGRAPRRLHRPLRRTLRRSARVADRPGGTRRFRQFARHAARREPP